MRDKKVIFAIIFALGLMASSLLIQSCGKSSSDAATSPAVTFYGAGT